MDEMVRIALANQVMNYSVIELRKIHQDADPVCVVEKQYGVERNREFGVGR
jgi:hypothetical protein